MQLYIGFKKRGFTLTELLIALAIIGLIAGVVIPSVRESRAKGRDAQRISDFQRLNLALNQYRSATGAYPSNTSGNPTQANFVERLQPLVDAGFIESIPLDPVNTVSGGLYYRYHRYGAGPVLAVTLETGPLTTTGLYPSCRPFNNQSFCANHLQSRYYCICPGGNWTN